MLNVTNENAMKKTENMTVPVVSDDEIVADLFRLARTERFSKASELLEAGMAMHPNETGERMKDCLQQLGNILWDTDHGGFATQYKIHGKRKRRSSPGR